MPGSLRLRSRQAQPIGPASRPSIDASGRRGRRFGRCPLSRRGRRRARRSPRRTTSGLVRTGIGNLTTMLTTIAGDASQRWGTGGHENVRRHTPVEPTNYCRAHSETAGRQVESARRLSNPKSRPRSQRRSVLLWVWCSQTPATQVRCAFVLGFRWPPTAVIAPVCCASAGSRPSGWGAIGQLA